MGGTISHWVIALKDTGLGDLANSFHTDKLEDYKLLKGSGLPVFDDIILPYSEFTQENKKLIEFLSSYSSFVVRAVPNTPNLPRKYKIGLHSFEEAEEFLQQSIDDKTRDNYRILITEHELNNKSGVIISRGKDLLIEVGNFGLDELTHGEPPSASLRIDFTKVGHISDKFFWEIKPNNEIEKLIKRSLNYIELTRDSFNPLFKRGYFEFVVTETDRIIFLDYKTNEMYLK